ncbi:hypothetical protein GH714_042275 [Hevea brasiliensis]|uniref:Cytochrome P450 n=1 Tax=Hevea brasiliensis TaxID=3981 RepID=A0A6A6KV70_HEVBR|nr:hypothetical protein GH714_042275 [Hevea brasiliensis]
MRSQSKHQPPGPPGIPIIGNLHQLGKLRHQSLWQFSKKYGPVMLIQLGRVPTLIVSSADAAKEVLKTHDLNTCSRPLLAGTGKLSYNYLDIAFTPYGDYWREMRKICVLELFSAKRVQSFQFVREEEVDLLINSISNFSSSATPVDLSEKILSLTANITCRAAFGKSFQERGFSHERFQEIIHEGDDDHIQKRSKQHRQEDFIDVLLEMGRFQTESAAIQLSQDHIKAILMNIFLAGVDTGAITMVWAMAELARHPRVMRKAQEEIRSCIGNKRTVSENDIDKLVYLKMVVKETMRLHPPSTLLVPRETMSKFSINGYEIQPKTRIQVNVWAIGRDPKIWRNPEEFFPERFIDNPIDFRGQHYELLPFGGGRRGCPGISMGIVTVELALANLLFCFDWKLPYNMKEEDLNMEEAAGLTTYKKEALMLVPIKHQPA